MQAVGMIGYKSRCAVICAPGPAGLYQHAIQLALLVLPLTSCWGHLLVAHCASQMLADKPSAVSTLWPRPGL